MRERASDMKTNLSNSSLVSKKGKGVLPYNQGLLIFRPIRDTLFVYFVSHLNSLPTPLSVLGVVGESPHVHVALDDFWP